MSALLSACRQLRSLQDDLQDLRAEHAILSSQAQHEQDRISGDDDQRVAMLNAANAQLLQVMMLAQHVGVAQWLADS